MRATLAVVLLLPAWLAGCAECETHLDCAGADLCNAGACVAPLTLVSATSVDETFSVDLEARFPVGTSTVRVERGVEQRGEPCLAFTAQELVVENTTEDYAAVPVHFEGLQALGPDFDLVFRLGSSTLTVAFSGPAVPADVGGLAVQLDVDVDTTVDVIRTPTTRVLVDGPVDEGTVVNVPAHGLAQPLQTLVSDGEQAVAEVLLLHGPQAIEVRGDVDGVPRRCQVQVDGDNGKRDDEDTLEFLLVSDTIDGSPGGARLSTRHLSSTTTAIVDGSVSGTLVARSVDIVEVPTVVGLIDVAVIPVAASAPIDVLVRVSQRGTHVGVFGPITLQPAAGETWIAGSVLIDDDGSATAVPSSLAPQVGTPW